VYVQMAVGVHYNRAGEFIEWIREREDIHNSLDEDALKEEDVVAEVADGKKQVIHRCHSFLCS